MKYTKEEWNKYMREFYSKNKESILKRNKKYPKYKKKISSNKTYLLHSTPEKRKNDKLKHRYGISLVEYEQLVRNQNGLCQICGQENSNKRSFHVDHDHTTGKIRGILCSKCNICLGLVNDDIEILTNAINYLNQWTKI